MKLQILAFVVATITTLIFLVASGMWLENACFPYEIHTFKWQCELVLPSLGLSFALPAALYGYLAMRSPWIEGFVLSFSAAIIATVMSYFSPFFSGPNLLSVAVSTMYYAILPGIIGALAGFKIKSLTTSAPNLSG